MNMAILGGFFVAHVLLGGGTIVVNWLKGGSALSWVEALALTPLEPLVGSDSVFGQNSLDRFSFENATNLIFGPVKTFYGLFSFNYEWLNSDGVVGGIGLLLSTAGHLAAAWLLYQVARAGIGGFLSFAGR